MASQKDITFASAANVDLKLDVYRPASASVNARTAILLFHGGGWRVGSREIMRPDARALAELGFVGIPAQYRLRGQAEWPAQIHDVKAAIRWTRAHADELGIDPQRVVVWGSSAGAQLALVAAGLADGIDFVLVDLWKDMYVRCLELFFPKLKPGAVIVADNMLRPKQARQDALAYRRAVRAKPGLLGAAAHR